MSPATGLAIAVLAALGAACSFGFGVALQHRQIQRERGRSPLRLLSRLARRRLWLAGVGLAVAAYALQAVALAFGPLSVVAPVAGVLIGTVVFAQRLATSPGMLVVQVAAATGAVVGIMLLGRSPLTTGQALPLRAAAAEPSFYATRSHV
jgi:hypothetical protein